MFECTPVFHANRSSKAKIKINQGGTSSSKTYSIMQLLFLLCIENPGCVTTVTGESIPNLKKGAYRDAETIFSRSLALRQYIRSWNKSERIIFFKNGAIMEFISNLDEQTAKNGKRDFLFVNEAQGVAWPIFFQLAIRTRRDIFCDYNPTAPFYVHEKLIGTDPTTNDLSATIELIISDHRHNCFLSEEEHQKIEGIKDKDLWRVYARGLTGNLTGLIFPNAKRIPDEEYPWDAEFIGGLDFGYSNDPTAGVRIVKIAESIFLHQLCYKEGLAPIQLKQLFWANSFTSDVPVYCEHDPDMISKLRRLEMMALQARKGTGSLNAGLLYLKGFSIFYTASSTDLDEEKGKYMWITDPVTGKPTNTPIDQFNHLWDATRYGAFSHWYRRED